MHNVTAVPKHPRLQKNLLGGFLYRLVLDKDPSRQFKPFVSARVAEIQETVGVDDFRYVRSKSNPADKLTRGTEPSRLTDWLEGPSFLQLPGEKWPDFQAEEQSNHEKEAEVLKEMKTSGKAFISAKPEIPVGDVNAVSPEAATTEPNAKPEQVKSEDNTILQKLLENCSLARVIATYPGNDGLVRKARIKTQDSEYDRPIHKLCLDELNADRSS